MTIRISRACVLIWLALLLSATGCGEDVETGVVDRQDLEPEALIEPEAMPPEPSPTPDPIVLEVTFVEVSVDPLRHVYAPGLQLLPEVTIYDQFGREMEASATLNVEPDGAAELQDSGRWRLDQEGALAFVACVAEVCGRFDFVVDAGGPIVSVTSPAPGAQLLASDHPDGSVEVSGTVSDSSGELHVFINGLEVPLDENGAFSTEVTPEFGINHVEAVATDGLQAVEATGGVDFLWATAYKPASEEAVFDDGIALRIGRTFFDDSAPLVREPEATAVETQDLADILELLLQEVDILSQFDNPIANSDALRLSITEVDLGRATVDVTVTETGLELYIQLDALRVETSGRFSQDGTTVNLSGGVEATVSALALLRVSKAGLGSRYDVRLEDVVLAVEEAQGQFLSREANALFALTESALRRVLETELLAAVEGAFIDDLPGTILSLFRSLEQGLDGITFPLNTGLGPRINVTLSAQMATLTPNAASDIEGVLRTSVTASGSSIFPESRGVGLDVSLDEEVPFFRSSALQIALRQGLLNGLLHSIWSTGILEINLFDVLPDEIRFLINEATVSGRLPPMLTRAKPSDDLEGDFIITLGQLEMDATFDEERDVYGFNIQVGASLSLEGGNIKLTLLNDPRIQTWLISSTGQSPQFDAASLRELVLSQVWPRLDALFSESFDFPIPSISLDALALLAPSLSDFSIDLDLVRPLDVRGGYIIFDGIYRGTAQLTP